MSQFNLQIKTDNQAFEGHPETEISRILSQLGARVACGERWGLLRDINGNPVGSFELEEDQE